VAAPPVILLDTGPWVALLCRDDRHHAWTREQFGRFAPPFITCEAVVSETCFLLARGGHDPAKALALIERGVVQLGLSLGEEIAAVRTWFERYGNVPASLADACLIRLSELHAHALVLTLDSDFMVYRRHGRRAIPVLHPTSPA
jgi:predicted nucleic acid-binding protein